jgi:hypothetical protein
MTTQHSGSRNGLRLLSRTRGFGWSGRIPRPEPRTNIRRRSDQIAQSSGGGRTVVALPGGLDFPDPRKEKKNHRLTRVISR